MEPGPPSRCLQDRPCNIEVTDRPEQKPSFPQRRGPHPHHSPTQGTPFTTGATPTTHTHAHTRIDRTQRSRARPPFEPLPGVHGHTESGEMVEPRIRENMRPLCPRRNTQLQKIIQGACRAQQTKLRIHDPGLRRRQRRSLTQRDFRMPMIGSEMPPRHPRTSQRRFHRGAGLSTYCCIYFLVAAKHPLASPLSERDAHPDVLHIYPRIILSTHPPQPPEPGRIAAMLPLPIFRIQTSPLLHFPPRKINLQTNWSPSRLTKTNAL